MAEVLRDMITRSIYINKSVWEKAQKVSGGVSVSFIISSLLTKWMAGEIELSINPLHDGIACPECDSPNFEHIGGNNHRCEDCGLHFAI